MNQPTTTQQTKLRADRTDSAPGSVASLWRYPVKSMGGEELALGAITDHGMLGDRAYALLDESDGKVATAKNPRKWPGLFDFRGQFTAAPAEGSPLPPVRVTVPGGGEVRSDEPQVDDLLSRALGRRVTLQTAEQAGPLRTPPRIPRQRAAKAEEYWPDMDGLDYRDTVTDFDLPEGTFFDCAVVHVLTTATLDKLRQLYPGGRFDVRRFRPNIVVQTPPGLAAFVENDWVGRSIQIGDEAVLDITESCARCVMTTLAQGDLPRDPEILRTLAHHNSVNAGVYASVAQGGIVRRGDLLTFVA